MRIINVREQTRNAIGDGITDDTQAFNDAVNAIINSGQGGCIYVPSGTYLITSEITLCSNLTICGDGAGSILKSKNTKFNSMIARKGIASQVLTDIVIKAIALEGNWQDGQKEGGNGGLITATYIDGITVDSCFLSYSCFMGINMNNCTNVKITNNTIRHCVRDMIAVWNTPSLLIHGNILQSNDDDAISFHHMGTLPVRRDVVISNNTLTDTGGIRCLSMTGVTITGNRISRPKGYGIACLNSNPGFVGLMAASSLNKITNNTITDVIDRLYFVDGSTSSDNLRTYIMFDSVQAQAGGLSSIPGTPNGSGVVSDPYGYYYSDSGAAGTDPLRFSSTNVIGNNTLKRTLPSVAKYSDWGFGEAFTKNGFIDLPVTETHIKGQGIAFRLPQESLLINNNIIDVGNTGIIAQLAPSVTIADRLSKSLVIQNNFIRNCIKSAIDVSFDLNTTLTHQDITVKGNIIDCDPYFISTNRGASGTWQLSGANGFPFGINAEYTGGIIAEGNQFRNTCTPYNQGGASAYQTVRENLLFGNPVSTGFSTSNQGIGTIPPIGDGSQWWLQFEDSDPASAQYLNSLGTNAKSYGGIPVAGSWMAGTFVRVRSSTVLGTAGNKYMTIGYTRLTTGNAHVLNTDWAENRALTGT